MTWWQIAIVVWVVFGAIGGVVIEACEASLLGRRSSYADAVLAGACAAPLVLVMAPMFVRDWRTARAQRHEAAVESAYQEVLRLIDYQPKTRTAVDDLVDELEIGGRAPGGGA